MIIRILGAFMVIIGCSSVGYGIAYAAKREIIALQNFSVALEYMECELQYRMTPLPSLCHATSNVTKGSVSKLFQILGTELDAQISPNVSMCMAAALTKCRDLPSKIRQLCENLGDRLGVFDLDGQVRVLSSLREESQQALMLCSKGYDARSRSCKTIAVCAGAAIVILLI